MEQNLGFTVAQIITMLEKFRTMGQVLYDELEKEQYDHYSKILLAWSPETRAALEDLKGIHPCPSEMEAKISRFTELLDKDAWTRGYMAGGYMAGRV